MFAEPQVWCDGEGEAQTRIIIGRRERASSRPCCSLLSLAGWLTDEQHHHHHHYYHPPPITTLSITPTHLSAPYRLPFSQDKAPNIPTHPPTPLLPARRRNSLLARCNTAHRHPSRSPRDPILASAGTRQHITAKMPALTSAAGLVGFLSEPDPTLQAFALERLNEEIDSVWTEVTGSIGQMYVCCNVAISYQSYVWS